MFFALMSRATTVAYEAIFAKIKNVHAFANLCVIMTDFEAAERAALKNVFGDVQLAGCNVHFDRVLAQYILYSTPDSNVHLSPPTIGAKIAYFSRKSDLRVESKICGAKVRLAG